MELMKHHRSGTFREDDELEGGTKGFITMNHRGDIEIK